MFCIYIYVCVCECECECVCVCVCACTLTHTQNIAFTNFPYCPFVFPPPVLFLWNFPSPARATTGGLPYVPEKCIIIFCRINTLWLIRFRCRALDKFHFTGSVYFETWNTGWQIVLPHLSGWLDLIRILFCKQMTLWFLSSLPWTEFCNCSTTHILLDGQYLWWEKKTKNLLCMR